MNDLKWSRLTGGNTYYKRVESDFYPTPPEATQALLDFLEIPENTLVWEPACGKGHMTRVMENNNLNVIGTDILTGTDFLTADMPDGVEWIITNPPFSLAERFIRKCGEHKKPFALLLKSQYWHAAKRYRLFVEFTPAYVLPLTWRPDFLFGARGGASLMDVIWCVWLPYNEQATKYIPLEKPSGNSSLKLDAKEED